MSSLDHVHEDMKTFLLAFREFNEDLQQSLKMLRDRHEDIAPLWTDEASRKYHQQFAPFEEMLSQYVTHEGPRLERYIEEKFSLLERYLYGD